MKRLKLFIILTMVAMTMSVIAGSQQHRHYDRRRVPPLPDREQRERPNREHRDRNREHFPNRDHDDRKRDQENRKREHEAKEWARNHRPTADRERPKFDEKKGSKGGWTMICEFSSEGDAKEVLLDRKASQCKIEVVSGSVILNTIVIRRGGAKQNFVVSGRFAERQTVNIPVDRNVTGLRISDGGKGRYRVYYK